jgi:anaerobic ribonucleoside-triphosphate reductase
MHNLKEIAQTMKDKDNNEIVLDDKERQACEVWTRVMGYHRPVSEFNPGKKSEHAERKHFIEPKNV